MNLDIYLSKNYLTLNDFRIIAGNLIPTNMIINGPYNLKSNQPMYNVASKYMSVIKKEMVRLN
jgi:hypothetical protein